MPSGPLRHPRLGTALRALYQEAARSYRHRARRRWAIGETYIKVAGVPCYVFRAIDEQGRVIDVYVSPTRDTAAALAFLRRVITNTGVRPERATTARAAIYPPALRAGPPETEHCTGKAEQQAIERDHQHLEGRYRPMRGFKRPACARAVCAGHGFVRNLRDGLYRLGSVLGDPRVRRVPRLMVAWDEITGLLQAALAAPCGTPRCTFAPVSGSRHPRNSMTPWERLWHSRQYRASTSRDRCSP